MIKANELRIGYLIDTPEGIHPITGIHSTEPEKTIIYFANAHSCDARQAFGIPITIDWLEKLGFTISEGKFFKQFNKSPNVLIVEPFKEQGGVIYFKGRPLYGYNPDGDPILKKIEYSVEQEVLLTFVLYVHELQNLYFALTGEELTIKLPA